MKLNVAEQLLANNLSDRLFELRRTANEGDNPEEVLIGLSRIEVEGLQKLFDAAAASKDFPPSFYPGVSTLIRGMNDRLREQRETKDRKAFDEVLGTIKGNTP